MKYAEYSNETQTIQAKVQGFDAFLRANTGMIAYDFYALTNEAEADERLDEQYRQFKTRQLVPSTLRIEKLAAKMEMDCPADDCVIFKNIFRMYKSTIADYEKIVTEVGEITARAIEMQILKFIRELDEMYFKNHAVQLFKESSRKQ